MDVLDRANALARSGRTVFHLEAGQPGTRAPKRALEAAQKALADDKLGYTEAVGRPALRERISRFYRDTYAVDVAPERIIITTGSSAGFLLAFIALFESGQSLAMAVPGYPAYRNIALALGLRPHFIPCREAEHFRLTAKAIAATPDIDGVLIASPGNPSGTVIPADELAAIADACDTRGLKLISDEIYHGITYGERAQTALAFSRNAIVINSFSKYFSMTGWRIGWMVVPDDLVRTIERLTQNFYISPPTISQVAALAALDATDEARRLRPHLRRQPRTFAGGAKRCRLRCGRARRRRVLPLRQRVPVQHRRGDARTTAAGRNRRRRHPRPRLRSVRRRPLDQILLRRRAKRSRQRGHRARRVVPRPAENVTSLLSSRASAARPGTQETGLCVSALCMRLVGPGSLSLQLVRPG